MKKQRRVLLLIIISGCISISICLVQFNNYIKKMLNLDSGIQDYATFAIQHESNPLDKDFQDFVDLYNNLILDNHGEYEYYELYMQYLENSAENLRFYYYGSNELIDSCPSVNAIQVSENVIRDFNITVSAGDLFDQGDYLYEQDGTIPILMGNAYSSIYNLGDSFTFTYLFDEYEFKVIGFLERDVIIKLGGKYVQLDTYIIMPSFTVGDDVSITDGLKIHYANKTSGIVKMDKDKADLFYSEIKPLLNNANVGGYTWIVEPIELYFKDIMGISIFAVMGIIYAICLILLVITALMISKLTRHGSGKKGRLNSITNGIIVFCSSSLVYLLINFLYAVILGIIVRKTICFVVIAAASICIVGLCEWSNHNLRET